VTAPSPLDLFRLDGRCAIVTGASSGLGARFVEVLVAAGANVVATARRADRLEQVCAGRPGAVPVAADVTVETDRAAVVALALDRFGAVDVLVNNAGVTEIVAAEEESPEQFGRVLELNLTASYRMAQLAGAPMLGAGRGAIINVTSVLGSVAAGVIPQVGYVASKHAVVGMTRELAAQWARRGVRVNAIAPGWFATEMTGDMTTSEEGGLRWIRSHDPMGRPGLPHELDGALLYLAGDASSYVTGQVLHVDGGWTIV